MIYRNVGELIAGQETVVLPREASVYAAAQKMAARRVGAVAVLDGARLVGLFTERDLLNRVVAVGKDPRGLTLDEVMTPDPVTIRQDQHVVDGLDLMFGHGFRHLPVLDMQGNLAGVMSCRDVPAAYQVIRERWHVAREDVAPSS